MLDDFIGTVSKALSGRSVKQEIQEGFVAANKMLGDVEVGADAIMVIKGYEFATFLISSHSLPTALHKETVPLTTNRGVETSIVGYTQTLNNISVTFNDKQSGLAKTIIESLLLEGNNGGLEILFFTGREITNMLPVAKMVEVSLIVSEGWEFESSNTTEQTQTSVAFEGHYQPIKSRRALAIVRASYNLLNSSVIRALF